MIILENVCAVLWRVFCMFGVVTISTFVGVRYFGDTISMLGGVQYCVGDTISTVEVVQYCGGFSLL